MRVLSDLAWGLRHPLRAATFALAAIPAVRRHVLDTTALREHPMYDSYSRARLRVERSPGEA